MSFSTPINFSFNSDEINIIRSALGRMPHDDVQPIIVKIYETIKDKFTKKEEPPKQESEAPYGYKLDGTPRGRPGRKAKRVRK